MFTCLRISYFRPLFKNLKINFRKDQQEFLIIEKIRLNDFKLEIMLEM